MAMTENNSYEEARLKRLEENNKRFQDLGIAKISKSLTDLSKKTQQRISNPKPRSKSICNVVVEPRRSSRARNPVPTYRDDVDIDLPPLRKRSRSYSSSWASYLARPLDEVKTASYEERTHAFKVAEELQSSLQSGFPSFVKSMVRSHVYSCFWLGLPTQFCEKHLSKNLIEMVLEDENGKEYDAIFIGKRTGLSGGWRGFALDHKLDDGDAVVFELVEPAKFKVYIIRASTVSNQEQSAPVTGKDKVTDGFKNTTKRGKKIESQPKDAPNSKKLLPQEEADTDAAPDENPRKDDASFVKKAVNKQRSKRDNESKKGAPVKDNKEECRGAKHRKNPAPRSFRKKAC